MTLLKIRSLTAVLLSVCLLLLAGCAGDNGKASSENSSQGPDAGVEASGKEDLAEGSADPKKSADAEKSASAEKEASAAGKQKTDQAQAPEDKDQESLNKSKDGEGPDQNAEDQSPEGGEQSQSPEGGDQSQSAESGEQSQSPDGEEQSQSSEGGDQSQSAESGEQSQNPEGAEQSQDPEGAEESQPPEGQEQPETQVPADESIGLDPSWEFAGYSMINSGSAVLLRASENRKDIIVGVNAGHGTEGGSYVYTQCHPDGSPKVTGGSTAAGAVEAMAVSTGMTFYDGTPERDVTLRQAQILKDLLLSNGYDVLMIRDSSDVQLDNIARTVICNNRASCHIAIHWDGDGLDYDKGCYYMSVPDALKGMYPVSEHWQDHDRLGENLIAGLTAAGCPIMPGGSIQMDLTQTSYSTVPSVDIELGNAASDHSDEALSLRAQGLLAGINSFFGV